MLNINYNTKVIFQIFFLFYLTINTLSCQETNHKSEYKVIKRKSNEVSLETNKIKSKTEKEDIRFIKEITSKINPRLFDNIKKVVISDEVTIHKVKDTITYIVYDFIIKKNTNLKEIEQTSLFGIKRISLYETPVICRSFFNQEKVTCVCRNSFEPEYIKDERFINTIKEDTENRINKKSK